MTSIEIINLGIGNVDSVECWLESNGYQVVLIQSLEDSDIQRPLVIPGVCSTLFLGSTNSGYDWSVDPHLPELKSKLISSSHKSKIGSFQKNHQIISQNTTREFKYQ